MHGWWYQGLDGMAELGGSFVPPSLDDSALAEAEQEEVSFSCPDPDYINRKDDLVAEVLIQLSNAIDSQQEYLLQGLSQWARQDLLGALAHNLKDRYKLANLINALNEPDATFLLNNLGRAHSLLASFEAFKDFLLRLNSDKKKQFYAASKDTFIWAFSDSLDSAGQKIFDALESQEREDLVHSCLEAQYRYAPGQLAVLLMKVADIRRDSALKAVAGMHFLNDIDYLADMFSYLSPDRNRTICRSLVEHLVQVVLQADNDCKIFSLLQNIQSKSVKSILLQYAVRENMINDARQLAYMIARFSKTKAKAVLSQLMPDSDLLANASQIQEFWQCLNDPSLRQWSCSVLLPKVCFAFVSAQEGVLASQVITDTISAAQKDRLRAARLASNQADQVRQLLNLLVEDCRSLPYQIRNALFFADQMAEHYREVDSDSCVVVAEHLAELLSSLASSGKSFEASKEFRRLNLIAASLQYIKLHQPSLITDGMVSGLAQIVKKTQKWKLTFDWMLFDAGMDHHLELEWAKIIVSYELAGPDTNSATSESRSASHGSFPELDNLAGLVATHNATDVPLHEKFKKSLLYLRSPQAVLWLLDYVRAYDDELWRDLFGLETYDGAMDEHLTAILAHMHPDVLREGFAGRMRLIMSVIAQHFGFDLFRDIGQLDQERQDAIAEGSQVRWGENPELAKEFLCQELQTYKQHRAFESGGLAFFGYTRSSKLEAVDYLISSMTGGQGVMPRHLTPLRQGRLGSIIANWERMSGMSIDDFVSAPGHHRHRFWPFTANASVSDREGSEEPRSMELARMG